LSHRDGAEAAEAERRATPLDPYPGRPSETSDGVPAANDLGPDAIAILDGRTFMLSDSLGDVPIGSPGGLVHEDTRFLNRWELTLGGQRLSLLKSDAVEYYSAAFFLNTPDLPGLRADTLAVRRLRHVGEGALEEITVFNTAPEPTGFELRLACGADFADLFEVRDRVRDRSAQITARAGPGGRSLRFRYEVPQFLAETTIEVERSDVFDWGSKRAASESRARLDGHDFVWQVELAPRQLLIAVIGIRLRVNNARFEPSHERFAERHEPVDARLRTWLGHLSDVESDSDLLNSVVRQSVADLAALRITGVLLGEEYVLPAAGLPWFMTLFGRDTLITSLQTLWLDPGLAHGALHLLGALQGTHVDHFRDEEPGKIIHEVRSGELTLLGEKPHSPYYGTADATPLWLILLSEYWRLTGHDAFVRTRWHHVLAALGWIDRYGDRDGDGYIEYQTFSPQGLGNQCWKDSWDGVQFADGRIPHLPIAAAEIQGYVYDAKLRVAELSRRVLGEDELAGRLEGEARELYRRFNDDFWSGERGGYYVVGLDGDKRRIDSMTSNMGHLLWSGIVPQDRARIVADQLMSDRMFSGWGVRTLSTEDRGYNPIGYHVGTVWPHDNAIVALGLSRYGFREEANRIVLGQLEAAAFSRYRLPEVFAGFERRVSRFPVPYPTACSPQAWASGAPFLFVRAMLGLEARDGRLRVTPAVPAEIGRILVRRLHALGTEWEVEAVGSEGDVRRVELRPAVR
jgi:glycogen debranching enzyme